MAGPGSIVSAYTFRGPWRNLIPVGGNQRPQSNATKSGAEAETQRACVNNKESNFERIQRCIWEPERARDDGVGNSFRVSREAIEWSISPLDVYAFANQEVSENNHPPPCCRQWKRLPKLPWNSFDTKLYLVLAYPSTVWIWQADDVRRMP